MPFTGELKAWCSNKIIFFVFPPSFPSVGIIVVFIVVCGWSPSIMIVSPAARHEL